MFDSMCRDVIALALVAACGGACDRTGGSEAAPAKPAVAPRPAPPVDATAIDAAAPDSDAVLWDARPAVTVDGSLIFVPSEVSDMAKLPGLMFAVWDRNGKVVRQQMVMSRTQCDDDPACRAAPAATMAAQHQAAAALLAELHHKDLRPDELVALTMGPVAGYGPLSATAPTISVELSPTGTLSVKPAGHAAIERSNAAWRSVETPAEKKHNDQLRAQGKDACFNAAMLGDVLVDVARKVVIVTIHYHGNDTCWEGPDDHTVVAW